MKQTNASPKHSSWVYYLGTLAMLASMLLLPHLIPSWADGITPAGVSIACVFVGAIIGILTTNDLILCALFAMGGLVINGIQTPAQVISSFMGASYVWQIVVLYALCYVIIRDNTGEVIARFLLTRRFTQKYPMVMVMMLLFAFGLAAAFIHPAGWNLRRGRYRAQKQAGPPAMPGRLYHHVYRPYDHRQHGGP